MQALVIIISAKNAQNICTLLSMKMRNEKEKKEWEISGLVIKKFMQKSLS
jgi:hypothetical protein